MNSSKIILANQHQNNVGDSYLRFVLNQQTGAILAMKHTQEAMVVPVDSIASMPHMPPCILGLVNWRSRIVWAVDLPALLNLPPLEVRHRQYSVIIVKTESAPIGLVVEEIAGTARFMPDEIRSPIGHLEASLIPYLRGYVVQQQETLLVLDAQAIVQSSVLQNH